MRIPAEAGLLVLLGAAACAAPARPAAETLRPAGGTDPDGLAAAAVTAAQAAPTDVARQVAAAGLLFQAADLRLQRATLAWLDAHPGASRGEVLAAEEKVGDDVRNEVRSLCTTGLECAERGLAAAAADAGALEHAALHRTLLAWADGPGRTLMSGGVKKLVAALDAAVAADAEHDGASPLRLLGRFRSKAPWPYGDRPAALQALARAVAVAPLPVSHLFYGDALWADGRAAEAEAQWRLAAAAVADERTRWSADAIRELARRRLAAAP